jgi:hypothetical protein
MDAYTGRQPNLVGPVMRNEINKIIRKPTKNIGNTISDKISSSINDFYTNYIGPYKLFVAIIILLVVFLIHRYYTKKEEEEKNKSRKEHYGILKDIETEPDCLLFKSQPSFNPLYALEQQKEPVYYPPDPLPVNIPNVGFVNTRNLYGCPNNFQPMNTTDIEYNKGNTRAYYAGTYNTYQNAQDTNIINPLGYPNNFNTSYGEFVGDMTGLNQQNLVDYQTTLDNSNQNLIDGANGELKYSEYEIDPPYANDP